MKILRTNLVDTQFSHYEVRPFKAMEGTPELTYQCDIEDDPDYWCVVAFSSLYEELYPIAQFEFIEDANLFGQRLTTKLVNIKDLTTNI